MQLCGTPETGKTAGLAVPFEAMFIATIAAPVFRNEAKQAMSAFDCVTACAAVDVLPTDRATVGPMLRITIDAAMIKRR